MKWMRLWTAVAALLGATTAAHAGWGLFGGSGAEKCGGCCPTTQPACCAPTVQRPCGKIFNYQRTVACQKPPCCVQNCAPACCAPAQPCCKSTSWNHAGKGWFSGLFGGKKSCCEQPKTCAPACNAPAKCGPTACNQPYCQTKGHGLFSGFGKKTCCEQPNCAAPCAPACAAPAKVKNCQVPANQPCCQPQKCHGLFSLFSSKKSCCQQPTCAPACAAPAKGCQVPANQPCCQPKSHSLFDCFRSKKANCGQQSKCAANQPGCGAKKKGLLIGFGALFGSRNLGCGKKCCQADPCELATLIYMSQTACQPKVRQKAIDKLGKYDCACYPEILCALVYALNDADPGVRAQAADELGDAVQHNPCCCRPEVTSALVCALADCDKDVRGEAEEGLQRCGFQVVESCGPQGCCTAGCVTAPAQPPAALPTPAVPGAQPTPVPAKAVPGAAAPATPTPATPDKAAPTPPGEPRVYFPSRLRSHEPAAAMATR